MAAKSIKYSTTKFPYEVEVNGYQILIPAGTRVCNQTASGCDDTYRFVMGTSAIARTLTGLPSSILEHDLKHRGINVPAEFCHPYRPDAPAVCPPEPGSVFLVASPARVSEHYPHMTTVLVRLAGKNMTDEGAVQDALQFAADTAVRCTHDDTLTADEFCIIAAMPKHAEVWLWSDIDMKLSKA